MERKRYSLAVLLGLVWAVTAWGAVTTVLTDDFEDGNRDGWLKSNDGPDFEAAVTADPNLATGNALFLNNAGTSPAYLVYPFAEVSLMNPGESIELSLDVRSTSATSSTSGFRVGLMHDNGTTLLEDETGKAITDDDTGYFIRMAVSPGTKVLEVYEDPGNSSVVGGSGIARRAQSTEDYALTQSKHQLVLRVTRLSDGEGMKFDVTLDGTKVIDGASSDSTAPNTTFNELVLASAGQGIDFAADNIVLTTESLPVVNAGPVYLVGSVDGTPLSGMTDATDPVIEWSQVDAPAEPNAVFNDASQLEPTVSFDAPGFYTLRMTVTSGSFTGYDDILVRAKAGDLMMTEQAHWKFDGDSNDPDDAYYRMTQTVGTPQLVSVDNGYRCGGVLELNKGETLSYGNELGAETSFSVAFRFKPAADVGKESKGVVSKYSGNSSDPFGGWTIQYRSDTEIRFRVSSGYNSGQGDLKVVGSFPKGEWTHVVGTFDGETGLMNFYVNGDLVSSRETSQTSFDPVTDLIIGGANWSGQIDEVYLYDYAIDQDMVVGLYGACQNVPPLVNIVEDQVKLILPTDSAILNGEVTDNDETTMAWTVIDKPAGAQVVFSDPTALSTSVQVSLPGNYMVKLTATDSEGLSNSDTALFKLRPADFDGLEAHITFDVQDPNYLDPNSALATSVYYGASQGGAPAVTAGIDPNDPTDRAVLLDGEDDYLDYGKYLGSDRTCTVSMWIKPMVLGSNQRPADKWPNDSSGRGWMIRVRSGNNLAGMIGSGFGGNGTYMQAPTILTLTENVWVHVALTFDGNTACLYQNGALIVRQTDLTYSADDLIMPMVLGYRASTDAEYFNGAIDEVRVYDYALTPQEIKDMYVADGGDPWVTCTPGLAGDLNGDCQVDMADYAILSDGWQGGFTLNDLTQMLANWLGCDDLDLGNCL